ncbi:hypothetical protein PFISCL1PPCAC_2815, partial [Pristionchus fissidentatus]
ILDNCKKHRIFAREDQLFLYSSTDVEHGLICRFDERKNEWCKVIEMKSRMPGFACLFDAHLQLSIGTRSFFIAYYKYLTNIVVLERNPTLFDHAAMKILWEPNGVD